jgi:hypothetical protein
MLSERPPEGIDGEGIPEKKDETGDNGNGNKSWQIETCNRSRSHNQRTDYSAHSSCAAGLLQETTAAYLHAADQASDRGRKKASHSMRNERHHIDGAVENAIALDRGQRAERG